MSSLSWNILFFVVHNFTFFGYFFTHHFDITRPRVKTFIGEREDFRCNITLSLNFTMCPFNSPSRQAAAITLSHLCAATTHTKWLRCYLNSFMYWAILTTATHCWRVGLHISSPLFIELFLPVARHTNQLGSAFNFYAASTNANLIFLPLYIVHFLCLEMLA